MIGKPRLESVEAGKQRRDVTFVNRLIGGKSRLVDTIVDVVVDVGVDLVDGLAQELGIEVETIAGQLVEGRVEHSDQFGRLVVDDALALLVAAKARGSG